MNLVLCFDRVLAPFVERGSRAGCSASIPTKRPFKRFRGEHERRSGAVRVTHPSKSRAKNQWLDQHFLKTWWKCFRNRVARGWSLRLRSRLLLTADVKTEWSKCTWCGLHSHTRRCYTTTDWPGRTSFVSQNFACHQVRGNELIDTTIYTWGRS